MLDQIKEKAQVLNREQSNKVKGGSTDAEEIIIITDILGG